MPRRGGRRGGGHRGGAFHHHHGAGMHRHHGAGMHHHHGAGMHHHHGIMFRKRCGIGMSLARRTKWAFGLTHVGQNHTHHMCFGTHRRSKRRHRAIGRAKPMRKYQITMHLSLSQNAYYPGDRVQGTLHVNYTGGAEPFVPFRSLRLKFCGKEQISWGATKHTCPFVEQYVTIHGCSYREQMDNQMQMLQVAISNPEVLEDPNLLASRTHSALQLLPGSYSYPFEFVLPQCIPASFTASQGEMHAEVVYYIKAVMDVVDDFDPDILEEFRVLNIMPVQQFDAFRSFNAPAIPFSSMVPGCLCFKYGSVTGNLRPLNGGWSSVESNVLEAQVNYDGTSCDATLKNVTVDLICVVTLLPFQNTPQIQMKVGSTGLSTELAPGSRQGFVAKVPLSPLLAPSQRLIFSDVRYFVQATFSFGGFAENVTTERMPVFLAQVLSQPTFNVPEVRPFDPGFWHASNPRMATMPQSEDLNFALQALTQKLQRPRQEFAYVPPQSANVQLPTSLPLRNQYAPEGAVVLPAGVWEAVAPHGLPPPPDGWNVPEEKKLAGEGEETDSSGSEDD